MHGAGSDFLWHARHTRFPVWFDGGVSGSHGDELMLVEVSLVVKEFSNHC